MKNAAETEMPEAVAVNREISARLVTAAEYPEERTDAVPAEISAGMP